MEDNTIKIYNLPRQFTIAHTIYTLLVGASLSNFFYVTKTGAVYRWGSNQDSSLGDNTTNQRNSLTATKINCFWNNSNN